MPVHAPAAPVAIERQMGGGLNLSPASPPDAQRGAAVPARVRARAAELAIERQADGGLGL